MFSFLIAIVTILTLSAFGQRIPSSGSEPQPPESVTALPPSVDGESLPSPDRVQSASTHTLLLHISDTHVMADGFEQQRSNLRRWVSFAGNATEVDGWLCSGDLVEWSDSQADFDVYFQETARHLIPHITAPGNHDYQSRTGHSYAGFGYSRYGRLEIGNFELVAVDSVSVGTDYAEVERLLKENGGRRRLAIIEHIPLYVPATITCGGAPCDAPQWALGAYDLGRYKDMAARYDVELFFVGHDHTFFYTKDKDGYFEQVAAGDLGLANRYMLFYEDGNRLAFGNVRNDGAPPFAPITPQRYDSLNAIGKIYTADPVRIKVLGVPAKAEFQINGGAWTKLTNTGDGVWMANYDWSTLARERDALLSIKVTAALEASQSYTVRVAAEYPNPPPLVTDMTVLPPDGIARGTVPLTCTADDSAADITRGEWFIDGLRVGATTVPAAKSATFTYAWDTSVANPGEHVILCKVSDRFGRVERTARRPVTVPPPLAPALTITLDQGAPWLHWIIPGRASGLCLTEVWASKQPYLVPGALCDQCSMTQIEDTGLINKADTGQTRFYQVRTVSPEGYVSASSNEVGEFTYGLESGIDCFRGAGGRQW